MNSISSTGPVMMVFGTRPEAIKMAPVYMNLRNAGVPVCLCVTAQHREMLDQVLEVFDLRPDYDLNIMQAGQTLGSLTAAIIQALDGVIEKVNPYCILVHGDTTTTLAASLAAYYRRVPVGHVEAGLRTGDIYAPWPEEINRKLTGHIAQWHFAPTETARQNLLKEGIPDARIHVTGNTVIDALLWLVGSIEKEATLKVRATTMLQDAGYTPAEGKRMVLITGHRRENFGEGFMQICEAIKTLAVSHPGVDFVYPVHLNPQVQEPVYKLLGQHDNIYLSKPLSYLPFVYLMMHATLVITDSGGLQEEAPSLQKPVLVMREKTERPEAVDAGTVKLVGTDSDKIVREASLILEDEAAAARMTGKENPYGDGQAASRITAVFQEALLKQKT